MANEGLKNKAGTGNGASTGGSITALPEEQSL